MNAANYDAGNGLPSLLLPVNCATYADDDYASIAGLGVPIYDPDRVDDKTLEILLPCVFKVQAG
jgi:hypothetical protein